MTEKRWKAVERFVAAEFNTVLSGVGNYSPIERIPLLGREGPDLTVNEVGLVINVKSRSNIPARLFPKTGTMFIGDLIVFRLEELAALKETFPNEATKPWKQLTDWYELMDKWTKEFKPDGITSIVIHRPRMPYGHCGVIIKIPDLGRLTCRITNSISQ
jgi:hypothetical protein